MRNLFSSQAPLLIGCDIWSASRETLSVLGNKEVIDVNQDPLGVQARKLRSKAGLEVSSFIFKTISDETKARAVELQT